MALQPPSKILSVTKVGGGFRLWGWQQSPLGPGELSAHQHHRTSGWEGGALRPRQLSGQLSRLPSRFVTIAGAIAVMIAGTIAVTIAVRIRHDCCHDCCHDSSNDCMTAVVVAECRRADGGVCGRRQNDGGGIGRRGEGEGILEPPTCPPLQSHVPIRRRVQI